MADTTEFFPPGSLDPRPDLHSFRDRWFSSHLVALRERPLYPPAVDRPRTYRFLHLPTFTHPTAVTMTDTGNWRVTRRLTNGRGGYEPGHLVAHHERELTARETRQFNRLMDRVGFWEMPQFDNRFGLDGTECVVEGVRDGRYRLIVRWSPDGTAFADLVEFLLGLLPPPASPEPPQKDIRSFAELQARLEQAGGVAPLVPFRAIPREGSS
jgi:hypothetical protein